MKFSVLIAAHHHGASLREALAGVRAQTYANWELVVVEYASADETQSIVRDFGVAEHRPVHYLNLGENHGPASARNRLLDLATTDWVALLDPHDRWTAEHLALAAEQFSLGAEIVASDVRLMDRTNDRPCGEMVVPAQLVQKPAHALFKRDLLEVSSSVSFRRDLARRAGPFDPQFRRGETRDFWLRCALGGTRFAATHQLTCEAPQRSRPKLAQAVAAAEQAVLFYEKHRDLAAVPAAVRRRCLSASLVTLGRLVKASDPGRAARCFWRAWSLQPVDVQALGQFALVGWDSSAPTPALPVAGRQHTESA